MKPHAAPLDAPTQLNGGLTMKHAARLATLAIAGLALSPAWAAEAYTIWDNFNGADALDATRWQVPDRILRIEGGALRVAQRDLGGQSSNLGTYNTSWGTNLKNPELITQMRASVTVIDYDVPGCAANPTPSDVQARMVGTFFNAGPGIPTSRVNDVGAVVRLYRASDSTAAAGVLRVEGVVFQCTTADCNTGAAELGVADLGTASVGAAVLLKMDWEPQLNRFNFYPVGKPVVRVTYTANDSQAPFLRFRQIGTRTVMANCFSGARTDGFIESRFDNVSVNASAAP